MKIFVSMLLLALVVEVQYAQRIELLTKIPIGDYFGGLSTSEDGPVFLKSPYIVSDISEGKALWFSEDYETRAEVHFEWKPGQTVPNAPISQSTFNSSQGILVYGFGAIWGLDGLQILFDMELQQIANYQNPVFGDILFCNDGDASGRYFHSFMLPLGPNAAYKSLDAKATRALFEPGSGWHHPGLTIDSKNRLFLNGEILTRDSLVYFQYLIEKYGHIEKTGKAKGTTFDPSKYEYRYKYLGRDILGNWYWGPLVFDLKGQLIHDDAIDFRGKRLSEEFSDGEVLARGIDQSGDLYYLFSLENEILLLRQENTWAPKAKKLYEEARAKGQYAPPPLPATARMAAQGRVNDHMVRLRTDRNTGSDSVVIAMVGKGTKVEVLARSNKKETIDSNTAYWYIVRLPDKRRGWMFGAFVDVTEPESLDINDYPYERTVFKP